jgi:nucleotide-binding universal stress UspA family protein
MQPFKNILVGVDLTHCREFHVSELSPHAREAFKQAIWLAKQNSASLLFFAVLPISREELHQVRSGGSSGGKYTTEERAVNLLADLVDEAARAGVRARSGLVLGQALNEIIKEVTRGRYDLVVVGIRNQTWLSRMLFGNTALALFQHCPCPVWVARPGLVVPPREVLIATDLKAAGEAALRVGVPLGRLMGSTIHVLHPVEYPLDFLWGPSSATPQTLDYHARLRAEAEQTLWKQLRAVDPQSLGAGVRVHLTEAVQAPEDIIQKFIQDHTIDLLVKGTVQRSGVEGLMVGNTAAKLLPEVHCSILAVHPSIVDPDTSAAGA